MFRDPGHANIAEHAMSLEAVSATSPVASLSRTARSGKVAAAPAQSEADASKAISDFRDVMKLSPMQRMRANLLAKMNLTEDSLKTLDTEARQKIEEQIKAQIKEAVTGSPGQKTGLFTDMKA